ncbi:MAG TPA: OmpA family protein [Polyangiales bacterium]|nr:OmpA family protein [Polyangiales bacterium]
MTHPSARSIHCPLWVALACACAAPSRPPETLLQAREAYANAEQSESARFDPAGLSEAKSSLDQAEALFAHDADSARVETAAYVAMRRAERAKLDGETSRQLIRIHAAQTQAKQLGIAEPDDSAKIALAEKHADAAILHLRLPSEITVVDQRRAVLIRLPCEKLFDARATQLSAAARESLDGIAAALRDQGERRILIAGYTDAGDPDTQIAFSKARADAVASYLALHGVPRDKLATKGLGPFNPLAGNETASGRAENSRIEIMVRKHE